MVVVSSLSRPYCSREFLIGPYGSGEFLTETIWFGDFLILYYRDLMVLLRLIFL
jgi:hypothetical protein